MLKLRTILWHMCTQRVCKKRRLSWPGWLLSLGQRKNNRRAAWKWSVRNNNSRQIEYSVEEKGTLEYTIVLRIEISFPDTYRVFWICIDKHPFSRFIELRNNQIFWMFSKVLLRVLGNLIVTLWLCYSMAVGSCYCFSKCTDRVFLWPWLSYFGGFRFHPVFLF